MLTYSLKSNIKNKLILKSSRLFNELLNCRKNKAVCIVKQIVTTQKNQL